ncbi:hypothetical protein FXO38_23780 [Capsicum annuum]|nr:hypothetical protein FXO38_23780 [Capsicum annuum]
MVSRCQKLKLEMPVGYCNMFLEELRLDEYDSIDDTSSPAYELVPRARILWVEYCHNLTKLLIPTGTERLFIGDCDNLEILSVAGGTQIISLYNGDCEKLKRLREHMHELLPSLKILKQENCPKIESFLKGGLPFNLQVVWMVVFYGMV